MPKQGHSRGVVIDGLIVPTKIRKRGCSSSSSSSSRILHYRLNKKAVVVNKNINGILKSRSCTPVPTWKTTPMRSSVESPKHSQGGKSTRPVSARRLAATLWETNGFPSPRTSEVGSVREKANRGRESIKGAVKKEMMRGRVVALPPHLSDPSHSPSASEKMDRSGTGRHGRLAPPISHKMGPARVNLTDDSVSNASFMEIETRSRSHISSLSATGHKNRLKDISNALTTSKELLKIINRIWAPVDQPSSSMSLVSALHAELERARLHANKLIHEQRAEANEVAYLMKLFAEEKASWKEKAIEAAVKSVAGELEVERKLRRRLECLNKKLGNELAETKLAFVKVVKDFESEKRAREVTEQLCNELARNADGEKMKREPVGAHRDLEKERETSELGDKVKISEGNKHHHYEEKNSAIRKLRKQLEVFLGTKKEKNQERATMMSSHNHLQEDDHGEVVEDDAFEVGIKNKGHVVSIPRRDTCLQRSASEGFEDLVDKQLLEKFGKDAPRRSYNEGRQRNYDHKYGKNVMDRSLTGQRLSLTGDYVCGTPPREQAWPSRDPLGTIQESPSLIYKTKESSRKSKW